MQIQVAAAPPYQLTAFGLQPHPLPQAELIDVGGYRLALHRRGVGQPAVVLDSGMGDDSSSWEWVAERIARFTCAISYDRAGVGASEAGPTPRTSQDAARDLHVLLVNAGISGPYVLVGQSFGGFNVRLYASMYPEEVAGMVLVDVTHPDTFARLTELYPVSPPERLPRATSSEETSRIRPRTRKGSIG